MEKEGRPQRARSTIVDVAKAARVHPSTVSRALSAEPGHVLRPETRARVVAAADRLGYRPSALARSLRLQRTLTLGMLVPDIANTFLAGIIKGAEEAAHERGYTLVLCNTGDVPEREATYIRVLREREVDGILVASTRLADTTDEDLREDRFPFVLVNIGHVAGPRTTTTGAERADGAQAAARRHGLRLSIVDAEAWSELAGYRAARQLFRDGAPTAIFGANDLIALGVLRAAREEGLRVPEDLALAGFNDIAEAALLDLTTVRVPQQEMGARAARLLIARLEGELITEPRIVLGAQLVVRGSSGAAIGARRIA